MPLDLWRPWRKTSPEFLARYVNHELAKSAVPEGFFKFPDETLHDLRAAGHIEKIVRTLYDKLCEFGIEYDLEPVSTADPDREQPIRQPADIFADRGTCLDLTLLFGSLCLEGRLLPLVVLLETPSGGLHALLVVDGKYDYDARNEPRGWEAEHCERGWIDGKAGAKLWNRPDGALWKRTVDGAYVAIECTGFAKTKAGGRALSTLTFDEARTEAEKKLGEMSHVATLDVVRLQENKGYTPFRPASPDQIPLYQRILEKFPVLVDDAYDFSDLLESEDAFVGREWLLNDLAQFRKSSQCGYYCIIAQAGLGKTALAAEIARQQRCPAFFFSVDEGRTTIDACLKHLAADLIARFSLDHARLPERAGKDWNFLKTLLEEARKKTGAPVLLVIDAVDEADSVAGNAIQLPSRLPEGVHIVLTSRIEPVLTLSGNSRKKIQPISADDTAHKNDVQKFLDARVGELWHRPGFASPDARPAELIQALLDASEYNFKYLQYVLADVSDVGASGKVIDLIKLPQGLEGYYAQFWKGIEKVRDTEGWEDWDALYRPAIALLAAAREPVTSHWLSLLIKRSATEIEERALARWERFLKCRQQGHRWHIIHKSFTDFLATHHKVDVNGAHKRIVEHYQRLWPGPEAGSIAPPRTPVSEQDRYGVRHLIAHLRETADSAQITKIVEHDAWYDARMAQDPSGEAFASDVLQLWSIVEDQDRTAVAGGRLPDVSEEFRYSLSIVSVNSLSYNFSAELIEALVAQGRWHPKTALAAAKRNPAVLEGERTIAVLAPHLDEVLITEALQILRAGKLSDGNAMGAVLKRLCDLGYTERAFAEAESLNGEAGAEALACIADRLSETQLAKAIATVQGLILQQRGIYFPNHCVGALARLFRHAPEPILLTSSSVAAPLDGAYRNDIREAAALRWAELGRWGEAIKAARAITAPVPRGSVLARLLTYFPKLDAGEKRQIAEEALAPVGYKWPELEERATIIRNVLHVFDAEQQAKLLKGAFPDPKDYRCDRALSALAPALPLELLKETVVLAQEFERERRADAMPSLAIRMAELGEVERAVQLARQTGDSYDVSVALIRLLPRLAELGHTERAVAEAVTLDKYGRENFVPNVLVSVARHVPQTLLDRLRDRARQIKDADARRKTLCGIALAYARLGDVDEALKLAVSIDESEEIVRCRAHLALAWQQFLGDPVRSLRETLALPPGIPQLQVLEQLAPHLAEAEIREALQHVSEYDDDLWLSRRQCTAALLIRLAGLGASSDAWTRAAVEKDQHYLLANLVPHLPESERGGRVTELLDSIIKGSFDLAYTKAWAVNCLIPHLTEPELQTFAPHLDDILSAGTMTASDDQTLALYARRYAELGRVDKALDLAAAYPPNSRSGKILAASASLLDAAAVRQWLPAFTAEGIWRYYQEIAVPPLLVRLAQLGFTVEALIRAKELKDGEVKCKAIAALAPELPLAMLEDAAEAATGTGESARYDCAGALAAIAGRYAALGDVPKGMRMTQSITDSSAQGKALAAVAPYLAGKQLDAAIEMASKLWFSNAPSVALSALLPRFAERGLEQLRKGVAIACDIHDANNRINVLLALLPKVQELAASQLQPFWSEALHALSKRTRREFLDDSRFLIPIMAKLGAGKALIGAAAALEYATTRWP
jgi:AAA ATPase-like protein